MLLLLNSVSHTTLDTNYIGRNITDFTVQEILLGRPNDGRWHARNVARFGEVTNAYHLLFGTNEGKAPLQKH
jgi:hypothetical protein